MFHQELEECDKLPDKEHQLIRYSSDGCLLQVVSIMAIGSCSLFVFVGYLGTLVAR